MTDTPSTGHNSLNNSALRAYVERVERLEEEKRTIAEDIKEVYAEAKGNGYDPKIMRKIVSLRQQDPDKRKEERALIELYGDALGLFA